MEEYQERGLRLPRFPTYNQLGNRHRAPTGDRVILDVKFGNHTSIRKIDGADIKWNFTKFLIDRNGNDGKNGLNDSGYGCGRGKNQKFYNVVKTTEILLPIAYSKDTKRKLYMKINRTVSLPKERRKYE